MSSTAAAPSPEHLARLAKRTSLGSARLAVSEYTRAVLSDVLRSRAVNPTQYRLLLCVLDSPGAEVPLSELAQRTHMTSSAAGQALAPLEERGLVRRIRPAGDGRERTVALTDEGRIFVEETEEALRQTLWDRFERHAPDHRDTLAQGLREGAAIGDLWRDEALTRDYVASASLVAADVAARAVESSLRSACDLTLNEARVLQRLAEVGEPMRGVDLAEQLAISPATATRAGMRLEKRGLVQRLAAEKNAQAVFLSPTEAGRTAQKAVLGAFDAAGHAVYGAEERGAMPFIDAIRHGFSIRADRLEGTRHRELLESLRPLQ